MIDIFCMAAPESHMPHPPLSSENKRHSKLPPLLRQAVVAHEAGQLDIAQPLYRQFVDENPRHPTALQLLGLLHSQRGEYESAIIMMRESLLHFPGQAEVANNLGSALYKSRRISEALASFRHAIDIQPRYSDALRNMGLCYLDQGLLTEAEDSFRRCLEIEPDNAVTLMSLGITHRQKQDIDAAINCYEKAIVLRPDYADAHHNLGVCLRLAQRPKESVKHYQSARRLGLDRAELHHNMGNALIDLLDVGGAINAYKAALERNPGDLDSHRNLNSLLWQHGFKEDYLKSYQRILAAQPGAIDLRLAYAMALNQQEMFDNAEKTLRQGLQHSPDSSILKSVLAYTLEGLGRWDDALAIHDSAVNMPNAAPNHRISYARALLACDRPQEALIQAQYGAVQTPFDQRALAYLGLCWRLLGDERDEILNDYANLVQAMDIPVPAGYGSIDEFNERLIAVLEPLHIGKLHPAEQTLRGGSQTSGDLFDRRDPEIQHLAASLNHCIREYVAKMPGNTEHPLFVRRSETVGFSASWSVRLDRSGYHTMHVHPLGWISSAYYVQVPSDIVGTESNGGGLKFGEPDIDIGALGAARKHIQPIAGRLALFPSYMWHGTVPFESDEPRMTVAFDVEPIKQ
jgi:uncharacterized protein (TIGR02466 family)